MSQGFTEEEMRAWHGEESPKKRKGRTTKAPQAAAQDINDSVTSMTRFCPDKYIQAGVKLADQRLKAEASQGLALVRDAFEARMLAGQSVLDEQMEAFLESLVETIDADYEQVAALPPNDFDFLALGVAR
jgi:hypothetical protein